MPHAAIFYQPDGYVTTGPKLMGRQAAGEGFLRAAAGSHAPQLVCHTDSITAARQFAEQVKQYGHVDASHWIPVDNPAGLAEQGCLYLPGPGLSDFAWRRAAVGGRAYSLCGITHTTASHLATTAITDLLVAPVRSWDALICTSAAVRDTVRILLEDQATYLRQRLGATRFELPQLPVIPLGVHTDDYAFTADQRITARHALGIADDEVVFLFVGRLSFHAKAHPQQMFTALQRASGGRKIRLILCGWYANGHIEAAFTDGARELCPSVTLQHVDGRDAVARGHAWAAGDVFISMSDNIQETFGLTPVEAMAAGLPVIVGDWDGYKDTVRDGIDGFRVPSLMPPAPLGADLARRYENGTDSYDVYCGFASQLTAFDPAALEQACSRLITDTHLRKQMAAAGQLRARQLYAWSVIYRRYQNLWEELAERRRADADLYGADLPVTRPDRADPFASFASYPTTLIGDRHMVSLMEGAQTLEQRRNLAMNSFARLVQPDGATCEAIFNLLRQSGPLPVSAIVGKFAAGDREAITRGLVWLAKMEAVHIQPPSAVDASGKLS